MTSERSRLTIRLESARTGAVEHGSATAVIEDDTLAILALSPDDAALRVALDAIDEVIDTVDALTIRLHDGRELKLVSEDVAALREGLLERCRALPELTRTLRAFGSRRGQLGTRGVAAAEQQRFFAPLLAARVAAIHAADVAAIVAAFDSRLIAAEVHRTLRAFVAERHAEAGPSRRALEAELLDLCEPLDVALASLGEAGREMSRAGDDLRAWRAWTARLTATFETADRVWITLDAALDAPAWRP
jgi:hypothetical protein